MSGKSIKAVLQLNTTPFLESLEKTKSAVNTFKNSLVRFGRDSKPIENGLLQIQRALNLLLPYLNRFKNLVEQTQTFNRFATGLKNMATAVREFSSVTNTSQVGMIRIKEIIDMWSNAVRGLTVNVKGATASEQQESNTLSRLANSYRSAYMSQEQYNSSLAKKSSATKRSINDITQYVSATNRATSSTQRFASSNNSAVSSTNRLASATSRLGRVMSSLRMMGTMVGSMLAYNFAHHLAQATNETIQSKSEMEGYFKMLGYGQSEIQRFNNALDQTVSRFQRVNKYSLGETISSIGVEFNLTTDEMIKAMDVTSMITSEYLRAGRNANEASLAVKDVLQGQFQRLSRETGVKGEQLKEAGWNGDVNDVNSLLDALRKVAEDRNWDIFAEKANSLNDIVTILQNRFGEWSADMVNVVQPSIVGAFNVMMMVGGALGDVLSGAWKWLNGDGLLNQAVKWTGIATAIGLVSTALISYRTGANLAQIAQMGLRGSIMATIFGLKAEEVATYGSRNALIAKITSLKAEQVAELGSVKAIATRLLGLDAEVVKYNGLKGAIMANSVAREVEEAKLAGATATQQAKIVADAMEESSTMSTTKVILAKLLALDLETMKEKGLIVALAQRVASSLPYVSALKAEEVAEMSTAEAGLFLTASLLPLIAILAGLAVGLYALIKPLQDASEGMAKFNNILNNGKDIVANHRKSYDSLNKSYEKANDELNNLTKGTNEYIRKEQEVKALHDDVKTAQDNVTNSYKAYQRVISANAKFEETSTNIRIHAQTRLKDAYIKAGISSAKASELASHELREANEGAEQLRKTLQMLKYESDRSSAKQESIIGKLDAYGISDKQIEKYGENLANAQDKISQGMEAFMTSDDLMERVKGWFTIQQGRLEEWWTEFNALFEIRDWDGMRDAMYERLNYLLTGFGAFDWITPLKKAIGEKGIVGVIMEALFGEGDSDGALDIAWQWANDMVLQPIADWLNWFMEDPFTNFDITMDSFSLAFGKFLFGNDSESLRDITSEWFNNNVIAPITDWLNWFIEDPASHFDMVMEDASLWVAKLLFGSDTNTNLRDMLSEMVNTNIIQPLGQLLYNGIMSIPLVGDILQLLQTISNANPSAQDKGGQLARAFGNAVLNVIRNIPILGDILQLLGVIPQANPTAHQQGHGVGSNISSGTKGGMGNLGQFILQEFNDALSGIGALGEQAYNTAKGWAQQLWNGVNSILQRASPGFFHDQFKAEFGTDVPNAIADSGDLAYSSAQYYGQQVADGISSVNTSGVGLGGMVENYETDAQNIAMSSQMMGTTTTTAFNDMSLAVNTTTSSMASDVGNTYSQMQLKQSSSLQSMKTQNLTAYNEMYLKSHQSLIQMRDSTTNVTQQMISAWSHMKTQLVATANALRSESTTHFNNLSSTIGDFYRKIQNPSNWGAGPSGSSVRGARNTTVGRSFARGMRTRGAVHGAGPSAKYNGKSTMTIGQLKRMLCPSGDCGNIFDGYSSTDRVNVADFLATVEGEHGFGWSGWDTTHFNHIKNKSDQWSMKSPVIQVMGGIPTDANFKVGDFENGAPSISFSSFKSMAESIFQPGGIPYKHYMDSAWKGSWLGAIQAGACNCSDGAEAIIAFASACGFGGGQKVHGYWGNEGHFWAVINGEVFDTTAMQKGYGWRSPSVHGYGPSTRTTTRSADAPSNGNKTINLTVNINEPVYGVDDLKEQIVEASREAMREEFNDPYTVTL